MIERVRLAVIALVASSFLFSAQAAGPAGVLLRDSVKEVGGAPLPGPVNSHKAFISRRTLSQDETGAALEFEVALKMRNLAELQARVARGERISPQEMAVRYDPLPADYKKVADWISSLGFEITRRDASHLAVFARGRVSQIRDALHVSFARVTSEGTEYTSAVTGPSVPATLAPLLVGINGLQPHLRAHKNLMMKPNNLYFPGDPPFLPSEILLAYNNGNEPNITGTGQTIAIVIDTFPNTSDLTAFWSTYSVNQTLDNISFIQVVPGTLPAPSGEETLDTEWSSSVAPGAKVRVYATTDLQSGDLDQAYAQIYADVTAHPEYGIHQMSMSYGIGETYTTNSQVQTDDQYFAKLAGAGVTVFASSGDGGSTPDNMEGSTGPLQVDSPASDPNVTGVGGTSLVVGSDPLAYTETGWSLSGGGTSIYFPRPSWQMGAGVLTGTNREVPDVAAVADPSTGAAILFSGTQGSIGGTSWSSPTWAGFSALLNQMRMDANLPPLGILGARIYPMLGSVNLNDITSGTNGYSCGIGYDLVTGCGTPNLRSLAQTLGPSPMTVLHNFGDNSVASDGMGAKSGLISGTDGNFYGTTSSGGTAGQGTVYKMTPEGVVTILHSFGDGSTPNDGANPAGVIQGSDGNFYGVTRTGGTLSNDNYDGTVFQMTPQGVVTILHSFGSSGVSHDGTEPAAPLVEGTDGYYYGTTEYGGGGDAGTVFKISPQMGYTILHPFETVFDDGERPSGLISGTDGNFYGTTNSGGYPGDLGTVFKMTPAGMVTTLHSFGDGTVANDGIYPVAPLVEGTDGCFYGSASNGGLLGLGNIFKITSQGAMTILHQFGDGSVVNDGAGPGTALIQGSDGNFYGTDGGGANNQGTVFQMTASGTETILHQMGDGSVTTIDAPSYGTGVGLSGLVQAADGSFSGAAGGGGSAGDGIAFKVVQVNALNIISPSSTAFTVGYPGSFTVMATGPSGLTFGATGLPSWAGLDPETGVLSGTPPDTTGAPFAITLTLTSGSLPAVTQAFTLNVEQPAGPVISGTGVALTYTAGDAYNFVFQATGFPAPTFALVSGTLPPGLGLSSLGYLSGTPTLGGVYTGSISASDGVGLTATEGFSIIVQQAAGFTSTPLDGVTTVGAPYSFTFQASGYPAPTFSINTPLPQGVALSPGGVLSGTAAQGSYGVYSGTVTASNQAGANGSSDSQSYMLTVQQAPGLSGAPPSPTVLNGAYYYSFAANATGYPAPSYALISGSFPTGLTMTTGGILSGTATASGTFSGVVEASNGIDPGATENITIAVQPKGPAPRISSGLVASGTEGAAFNYQIRTSGTGITFGAAGLPAGLNVDTSTGLISGTPTESGTYAVSMSAANSGGTASAKLALTILVNLKGLNGFYAGLAEVGGTNVGRFTVSVGLHGGFTGKLALAGANYPLAGTFRSYETFGGTLRVGATLVGMTLALDPSPPGVSGTITATTTHGSKSYSVESGLLGVFNARTLPVGLGGSYTVIVPPLSGTDATTPNAVGYGTMNVAATGAVSVAGKLADGTAFSAGGQLDADGKTCTLFSPLYAGLGSIAGNLIFESSTESDCDGVLNWIKPAQVGARYYPGGFALGVDLLAARYAAPALQSGTAAFTLGDGDLPASAITDSLTILTNETVRVSGANDGGVTLTLSPGTGGFRGTFLYPGTGRETSFGGVMYEKPVRAGFGLFLGTDQCGAVEITQ